MKSGKLVKYITGRYDRGRIGIVIKQSNANSNYFHIYFGSECLPILIDFLELIE